MGVHLERILHARECQAMEQTLSHNTLNIFMTDSFQSRHCVNVMTPHRYLASGHQSVTLSHSLENTDPPFSDAERLIDGPCNRLGAQGC